jgi:PAS domain S-box-containing protein
MLAAIRRDWAWIAAAAALGGLFALLCRSWESLLLLPVLAGGTALHCGVLRRQYRDHLERLAGDLAHFRDSPSAATVPRPLEGTAADADLAPLATALDALCGSYCQALSDRLTQAEALESLRSVLGRADHEKGSSRTVLRGSGSSRNMVARLTPGLHWMSATPALQHLLGRPLAELTGRPFAEVVHPEDQGGLRQALQEALDTGEAHNITCRVLARPVPPGQPLRDARSDPNFADAGPAVLRHLQLDVMARYADAGPPLHLRCHFVDISDRVRAEEELRRSTQELLATNDRLRRINADLQRLKESYGDLYHNAPVMYFSLDAQGHFVTFNNTMLRVLGYVREDLFRQPYTRVLAPTGRRGFLEDRAAYQHAGEVETQWVKKDGTVLDVAIGSTPILDEQGRFVRSRSVAQDVTERNRLADELRRRRDELERANARLQQINNELDEFTSVVSHDLKEPLRTVEAYSTNLAQDYAGRLGPDGVEYLDHLVRASRRLGSLIDELLSLSLAGRVLRAPQAFDLMGTAGTVCGDLADLIRRRQAVVRIEGPLPAVIGDEPRVAQLLANLIGNGLKYNTSAIPEVILGEAAGPPGPGVRGQESGVRAESSPGTAHGLVTLYVRDNGIGIDPRFHEQVFGIFRRLHAADQYEGTGAGLAICKKIALAHGGRIWVESAPGQGATFFFTLPWSPVVPAPSPAPAASVEPGPGPVAVPAFRNGHREQILPPAAPAGPAGRGFAGDRPDRPAPRPARRAHRPLGDQRRGGLGLPARARAPARPAPLGHPPARHERRGTVPAAAGHAGPGRPDRGPVQPGGPPRGPGRRPRRRGRFCAVQGPALPARRLAAPAARNPQRLCALCRGYGIRRLPGSLFPDR